MAKYILLIDWTEAGVKNVKQSPARLDSARELGRSERVAIEQTYMVMGDHDIVAIVDAPDDAALARFVLRLAQAGSIRTKTLKAFTEDQYRGILGAL